MLVGLVSFLGSEVVLSPVSSHCLSCGGRVLGGVAAILGSEMVLSPVVSVGVLSATLDLAALVLVGVTLDLPALVGVGWCGRLLGL